MSHTVYPSLRNKRVVVTGGGSSIGAAIVERFAQQGARVAFLDIAEAESRELERASRRQRDAAALLHVRPDRHRRDPRICSRASASQLGPIDVLINNAANDDRHTVEEATPAYWDERIAVNLRHYFFCAQAVIADMKAAGGGAIINLGSVSWHLALPNLAIYQTAKAGIEGLTRGLARDLGSVRHPRELRRAGRSAHAAANEAVVHTGRGGAHARAAVPEGARGAARRRRHGPVPGI